MPEDLEIAKLIARRCRELAIGNAQLARSAGYTNISKGLRRLDALIHGDLTSSRGLIQGLPSALQVKAAIVSAALDRTRKQLELRDANKPSEHPKPKAPRPTLAERERSSAKTHTQNIPVTNRPTHTSRVSLLAGTAQRAKVYLRYSRHIARRLTRRGHVIALLSLFKSEYVSRRLAKRLLRPIDEWAASIIALAAIVIFLIVFRDTANLKISEFSLTCATIIGAALALILSLSIIPAQRAAEAFSAAVLRLYAQDRWLIIAFLTLACTATASALLGTNFSPITDARILVCVQFLLLGLSFDALRMFYKRTLDLLNPKTAIDLVVQECTKIVRMVSRAIDRLIRVQALTSGTAAISNATRGVYFSASQISGPMLFWIGQLEEIAHKLLVRRDTSAANEVVSALSKIGRDYSEARRNSFLLVPDLSNLLAGGVSDISDVLNPIYEHIRVINESAANSANESVVKHCISTLAGMTTHAMTVTHSSEFGSRTAPLAYSPCYWLDLCAATAVSFDMADAALAAVEGFKTILFGAAEGLK